MARNVKKLSTALSRTEKPVSPAFTTASASDGLSDFVSGMQNMAVKNPRLGIGTAKDQRVYTDYHPTAPLNRSVLESLYVGSWLGNRIISTLPEDALRPWRTMSWGGIQKDDTNLKALKKFEKTIRLKKTMLTAWKWARLYGGCLIIPILKSQPDEVLSEPLVLDQIQKDDLVAFHVLDRWRCNHDGSVVTDVLDPKFGTPEHYMIAESSVRIHHSRVIRFDGREVPYFVWRSNAMWNHSVMQILINNIKQYDTAISAITTMLFQMNVDVIMQGGLRASLSTKDGAAKVVERFRQFVLNKSFNGVGVLDKDSEEYQRHPYSFSGVSDIFDKIMNDIAGAADTPFTRLFGQSPGGLNATGDSDDKHYHNHVCSRREEQIDDQLTQIDQILIRSFLGYMPDDYESEWNDTQTLTDQEEVDVESKHITGVLKPAFEMGAIDEGVVASDLYSRGYIKGLTHKHVQNAMRVAMTNNEGEDDDMGDNDINGTAGGGGTKSSDDKDKKPDDEEVTKPEKGNDFKNKEDDKTEI